MKFNWVYSNGNRNGLWLFTFNIFTFDRSIHHLVCDRIDEICYVKPHLITMEIVDKPIVDKRNLQMCRLYLPVLCSTRISKWKQKMLKNGNVSYPFDIFVSFQAKVLS